MTSRACAQTQVYRTGDRARQRHEFPMGAMPAPQDANNKRKENSWDFHCRHWSSPFSAAQSETQEQLLPKSWQRRLDKKLLQQLGCTAEKVNRACTFSFLQMTLLMRETEKSTIECDPR